MRLSTRRTCLYLTSLQNKKSGNHEKKRDCKGAVPFFLLLLRLFEVEQFDEAGHGEDLLNLASNILQNQTTTLCCTRLLKLQQSAQGEAADILQIFAVEHDGAFDVFFKYLDIFHKLRGFVGIEPPGKDTDVGAVLYFDLNINDAMDLTGLKDR